MTSVFALVSAFTGGMSLAMDTLAGERELRPDADAFLVAEVGRTRAN